MDGRFVPNLTFGAKVIETVRKLHDASARRAPDGRRAGELLRSLRARRRERDDDPRRSGAASPPAARRASASSAARAGVAINPSTPLEAVREVASDLDLLLVMTVNPGFGGQPFIASSLDKVRRARALLDETTSRRRARGGRRHQSRDDRAGVARGRRHLRRRQRGVHRDGSDARRSRALRALLHGAAHDRAAAVVASSR